MADHRAEFWVLVSGKGGVGKSVLALNIGTALAEAGKRVLLLDADLGLANLHILANVEPRGRLERVLAGADRLDGAVTPLPFGPHLLAADNGQNLSLLHGEEATGRLAATLGALQAQYDYILVDTPRGISGAALQFCRACDRTLLVTTSEPTALTNAYAWYKIAGLQGEPFGVFLVANEVDDDALYDRFADLCDRFLGRRPNWGGSVPRDPAVVQAVARQEPLVTATPEGAAWKAIRRLARVLQETAHQSVIGSCEEPAGRAPTGPGGG